MRNEYPILGIGTSVSFHHFSRSDTLAKWIMSGVPIKSSWCPAEEIL
jgi:hypothetical protein